MYGFVFALDLVVNVRIDFVGIDIDYEVLGPNGGMLMVTASGTAVKLG